MGQKVNPTSFRLGGIKGWKSRWFSRGKYAKYLEEDHTIRAHIEETLSHAAVEEVDITRSGNTITVTIKTGRPGLVIGRGGSGLERLKKGLLRQLRKVFKDRDEDFSRAIKLEIEEVRRPESHARLVAKDIVEQLERRFSFRRTMKKTVEKVMDQKDVEGVKVSLAGRLGGSEIARTEHLAKGKVPLHTLRANIDYAYEIARTTYGAIGVKVWIYKGEVFDEEESG